MKHVDLRQSPSVSVDFSICSNMLISQVYLSAIELVAPRTDIAFPQFPFAAVASATASTKSEGHKKRKTKAASEDHLPLQVVTTKEDAKTKLAEDSSMMMERSLQVQPSVENPLLSMQDSIDSPDKVFMLESVKGDH
ncbi:cyclin-A2-2 [Trifolium repens]|nr:cyclin-A2-2 [Trifolium repens]